MEEFIIVSIVPYISIIIPSFNSAGFIKQTLESIAKQTFKNFEVIVIDDFSSDNSGLIISKYESSDSRFRLVSNNENSGPNFSRNKGISLARGKYVMFVDSDDLLLPDALQSVCYELSNSNVEILNFGFQFMENKKVLSKSSLSNSFLFGTEIMNSFLKGEFYSVCWNKVFLLEFLLSNKIHFVEDTVHGRDSLFVFDCMASAGKVKSIENILYVSNVRVGSFSRSFTMKNIDSLLDNVEKLICRFTVIGVDRDDFYPYIAKHLRYMIILASFRIENFSEYRRAVMKLKSSGYFNSVYKWETLKNLRASSLLITLMILFPNILFFVAKVLKKLNFYPY
jgi:glycosyltransferase involved in cell wall biosynthesis